MNFYKTNSQDLWKQANRQRKKLATPVSISEIINTLLHFLRKLLASESEDDVTPKSSQPSSEAASDEFTPCSDVLLVRITIVQCLAHFHFKITGCPKHTCL